MTRSFFVCSALTALTVAACSPIVVSDGNGDSKGALNPGVGNNTLPEPTAGVAMYYGDIAWPDVQAAGSSSSSGEAIDPDTLYIFLSSQQLTCADPLASLDCGQQWDVTIAVPPALQQVGSLSLDNPDLISVFGATGPGAGDLDSGGCYFGGGSYMDGTLEIVSIGADSVTIQLSNTMDFEFDADGAYEVPLCD